ncbi:MAG: DNA gyrase inhibitor YacG [Planctomycetota bacterium]
MIEVTCPQCRRRKVVQGRPTFPFCCAGCRDGDLSAWTEERYRIAGEAPPAGSEEAGPLDEAIHPED